jgi:hypothetical protein
MEAFTDAAAVASTGSWTGAIADVIVGSVLVLVAVVAFCIETVTPTGGPTAKILPLQPMMLLLLLLLPACLATSLGTVFSGCSSSNGFEGFDGDTGFKGFDGDTGSGGGLFGDNGVDGLFGDNVFDRLDGESGFKGLSVDRLFGDKGFKGLDRDSGFNRFEDLTDC